MMKHNLKNLNILNTEASKYYYSIEGRDYVHSTTFAIMVYRLLKPLEITLFLRKVVKSGFYFDDIPSENDIGYIQCDSSVFFIKENAEKLIKKDNFESDQELLYNMNNVIKYSYPLLYNDNSKVWSKKLYIYCPELFSDTRKNINVKSICNDKHNIVDAYIENILVWRHCLVTDKMLKDRLN